MKQKTHVLTDTLYSKTIDGSIKYWQINNIGLTNIEIQYGTLLGKPIISNIGTLKPKQEADKRYKEKYNKGYRSQSDLGIEELTIGESLEQALHRTLPTITLDENQCFKPMLCQTFKKDKGKWPRYAQPKINGLRGTNSFKEVQEGKGMFATTSEQSIFKSREGIEYVLPILSSSMRFSIKDTKCRKLNYDGELYIPGAPLNVIKSAIPYKNEQGTISKSNENTNKVQYWIFDLAVPVYTQKERLYLLNNIYNNQKYDISIIKLSNNPHKAMEHAKLHLKNSEGVLNIFIVGGMMIESDDQAIWYRDECIKAGFEGCVFRDMDAEYAFGQRPSTITKFKKFKTTECKILDIVDESGTDTGEGIKFLLKNDINNETFNCSISTDWDTRLDLFSNKIRWIGKYATVEYGERSGVKKCPFHANVIAWGREDIGDLDVNNLNKE